MPKTRFAFPRAVGLSVYRTVGRVSADRLKTGVIVASVAEARDLVAEQRRTRAVWFSRIRHEVRGG